MQKHLDNLHSKPFSWSCFSSWSYNKDEWAKKYLFQIPQVSNRKMDYGKEVGEKLATDPTFLPTVLRYPIFEQKLTATLKGIPLVGYLDSFHPETHAFYEYKSSSNAAKWSAKTAAQHGQLDFYFMLIYLNYRTPPEKVDCDLFYIPVTETADFSTNPFTLRMELDSSIPIQSFKVKKTLQDILIFAQELIKTYHEMESYALAINDDDVILTEGRINTNL